MIAVILLSALSLGLVISFNLIEQDRIYLDQKSQELEAKYNSIQQQLTETINKQDKMLMVMGVYRDGINTLKEELDTSRTILATNISNLTTVQEEMTDDLIALQEKSATGGFGVITGQIQTPMPVEDYTESVVHEVEEEVKGVLHTTEEEVLNPPILLASPPEVQEEITPVVFECPKFSKGNIDNYIRRINFKKTTEVLLTFDVIDGVVDNVVVRETNVANTRLFDALEKYLRDNALVEPNMAVSDCRLPFRINVE